MKQPRNLVAWIANRLGYVPRTELDDSRSKVRALAVMLEQSTALAQRARLRVALLMEGPFETNDHRTAVEWMAVAARMTEDEASRAFDALVASGEARLDCGLYRGVVPLGYVVRR